MMIIKASKYHIGNFFKKISTMEKERKKQS